MPFLAVKKIILNFKFKRIKNYEFNFSAKYLAV